MRLSFIKNYFFEIWLIILIAILSTIGLSSFILYKNFEKSMIDGLNQLNRQFLNETNRINEYFNKMVKLSGMELFFEPSIQKLINRANLDNFEILTGIRRIDSVHSMGMHIHSIYIYNAELQYVYSTSNFISDRLERFYDLNIINLLYSETDTIRLFPIPRIIKSSEGEEFVYSYIFYGKKIMDNQINGALIININLDWLKEIVETTDGGSSLFIVDNTKRVVYHADFSKLLTDISDEGFIQEIFSHDTSEGYFVSYVENEKSLVMYTVSEDKEMYFIRVFPYSSIMGNIEHMKIRTIQLLLAFIICGFIIAFFLSRRIYNPIGRLLVSMEKVGGKKEQDDFGYLTSTINNMVTRTSTLEAAAESYLSELRLEILKEVLEGNVFGKSDINSLFKEYAITFEARNPFYIIMVHGDLPKGYIYEDKIYTVIISMQEVTVMLFQKITYPLQKQIAKQLQAAGASAVVCGRIENAEKLSAAYKNMLDLVKYRIFFDKGHIFDLGAIRSFEEDYKYPTQLEQQIMQSLRSGDVQNASDNYNKMLQLISNYRYDHFRFSVKRLYVSIQILIKELQEQGCFEDYLDHGIDFFENLIQKMDYISELNDLFNQMFRQFPEEIEKRRIKRNQAIVSEIENLIQTQYEDPNFSLQGLSEQINLSSSYVSKIFKSVKNMSVSDYLNNYRIEKAKILLQQNLTIKETAEKVGFLNENYFYTLFKKKTSMTPNKYKQQHR